MKKVLAVLSINPDYIEFAIPQLKSLLRKLNIPLSELFTESEPLPPKQYLLNHNNVKNFPYVTLTIPNFAEHRQYLLQAAKKAVMVSKFVLLISQGSNYEELLKNGDEQILKSECRSWEDIVSCDFHSRNRSIPREQQNTKIHKILQQLDIRGKIDIKNAEKRFQLIEDHKWYQNHHESESEKTLNRVYFGIQLSNSREGKLKFNHRYQLGKRIYLGPTSADNDLAFMMCNQANIGPGSLVLDPFVGTGGLLIPPASMGALTFGSDLDIRVLNGYSVGRINKKSPYYAPDKKFQVFTPKIFLNFDQYGFIRPSIFRMDCINPSFRKVEFLDAIICDPPYGLRAMSRTVNIKGQYSQENSQIKQEKLLSDDEDDIDDGERGEQSENEKVEQIIIKTENKDEQQLTQQQKQKIAMKKKQKKLTKKANRKKKLQAMTEEERNFKTNVVRKMDQQRVKNWGKFDKKKVQTTQRENIFQGLLRVARRYLKQGGRLVFLYPTYEQENFDGANSLPKHQGFDIIDWSVNMLGKGNARVLVTLQKRNKVQ